MLLCVHTYMGPVVSSQRFCAFPPNIMTPIFDPTMSRPILLSPRVRQPPPGEARRGLPQQPVRVLP